MSYLMPSMPDPGLLGAIDGTAGYRSGSLGGSWTPEFLGSNLAAWYEPQPASGAATGMADSGTSSYAPGVFGTVLASFDPSGESDGDLNGKSTNGPTGVDALTWSASTDLDISSGEIVNGGALGSDGGGVDVGVLDGVVGTVTGKLGGTSGDDRIGVQICQATATSVTTGVMAWVYGTGTLYLLTPNGIISASTSISIADGSTEYTLTIARYRDRVRIWFDGTPGTDTPDIDHELTASQVAAIDSAHTNAGIALRQNGTISDFSVRTVDPAVDFLELYDTFTDTDGVALDAHTPDFDASGAGWTTAKLSGNGMEIESNQASHDGAGRGWAVVESEVDCDIRVTARLYTDPIGGVNVRINGGTAYYDNIDENLHFCHQINGNVSLFNDTTLLNSAPLPQSDAGTYDWRAIRKDDRVWIYQDGVLVLETTLSASVAAATSLPWHGFFGAQAYLFDDFYLAPAPSVPVAPDLSGQHRHAVQTQDGTGGAYLASDGLRLPGNTGDTAFVDGTEANFPTGDALVILAGVARPDWTDFTDVLFEKTNSFRVAFTATALMRIRHDNSTDNSGNLDTASPLTVSDGYANLYSFKLYIDVDDGGGDVAITIYQASGTVTDPASGSWSSVETLTYTPGTNDTNNNTADDWWWGDLAAGGNSWTGLIKQTLVGAASSATAFSGGQDIDADFTGKTGAESFIEDSANAATVTINTTLLDRRPLCLPAISEASTAALVQIENPANTTSFLTAAFGLYSIPFTHACVAETLIATPSNQIVLESTDPTNYRTRTYVGSGSPYNWAWSNQTQSPTSGVAASGPDSWVVSTFVADGATYMRTNGTSGSTVAGTPIQGKGLIIGSSTSGGIGWEGYIPAVVISFADETANIADLETYLANHTSWSP